MSEWWVRECVYVCICGEEVIPLLQETNFYSEQIPKPPLAAYEDTASTFLGSSVVWIFFKLNLLRIRMFFFISF